MISYNKIKKCTNVKIIFLQIIFHNSDMFRCIFVIFMELLNINKECVKNVLYVHY